MNIPKNIIERNSAAQKFILEVFKLFAFLASERSIPLLPTIVQLKKISLEKSKILVEVDFE